MDQVSYSRGAFRIAEQWLRVDSSYQEGSELESRDPLISKRVIRVVNGTNVVAEGRIAGRAFLRKSEKETLCGLSLGFGSAAEAERAALAMREDMETTMRRKIEDRRSWRI